MENYNIDEVEVKAGQVLCVIQKQNKKFKVSPVVLNKRKTKALNLATDTFYRVEKEETEYGETVSLSTEAITQLEEVAPVVEVGRFCTYCDKCAWKLFKNGDVYENEKLFRALISASHADAELTTQQVIVLSRKIEKILNNVRTVVEKDKIKTLGPSGDVKTI